jgi:hypothetical protein
MLDTEIEAAQNDQATGARHRRETKEQWSALESFLLRVRRDPRNASM